MIVTTALEINTSLDVIRAEQLLCAHQEGLKDLTDSRAIEWTENVIAHLSLGIKAFRSARKQAIFGCDYIGKGI